MDRAKMATTVRSTGNRPGQPVTRDLRCVFGVPSAPLSPGRSCAIVVWGGTPTVRLGRGITDIMKEDRMTAAERPSQIPDSYRRVTPCLTVQGAAKALEFYAAVFGATERMRFPGPSGTILHAEVQIGDSVVMIEDEDPQRGTKAPPPGGLPGFPAY